MQHGENVLIVDDEVSLLWFEIIERGFKGSADPKTNHFEDDRFEENRSVVPSYRNCDERRRNKASSAGGTLHFPLVVHDRAPRKPEGLHVSAVGLTPADDHVA
jgi:hypothetical protein